MRKLCIECKHYRAPQVDAHMAFPEACAHEDNKSLVDDSPVEYPRMLRYGIGKCGPSGIWWEPK